MTVTTICRMTVTTMVMTIHMHVKMEDFYRNKYVLKSMK